MTSLSIHKTHELPPHAKNALESLLGFPLVDEEVSIWTSAPHSAPKDQARPDAWGSLREQLDGMAAKVQGPPEELEKLVDEVCGEVRYSVR